MNGTTMPIWEIMLGTQCALFVLAGIIVAVWMTRPDDRLDAMLLQSSPATMDAAARPSQTAEDQQA
jgi:hypothetical protein